MFKQFTRFQIEQTPCAENTPADALASIASTCEGEQGEITINSILQTTHDILNIGMTMSTQNDI